MRIIRYGRHFALLAVSALVFAFVIHHRPPHWLDRMVFPYVLMGALHAVSLICSMRDRKVARPTIAAAFTLSTAFWSYATPLLAFGAWGLAALVLSEAVHVAVGSELKFTMLFLVGSAIGASGYWALVELFWFKVFRLADLLRTVSLCVAATWLCLWVPALLDPKIEVSDVTLTTGWWIAFSASLYWSEVNRLRQSTTAGGTNTNPQSIAAQ